MALATDLRIDVTEAAGLGEPVEVAITVHRPDGPIGERPVVCFAKPGGGYSRGYYTVDLPGPAKGSQAAWHADRGWIFVSVDHLGVGGSTVIADPERLDYTTVAAGSMAAEQEVLERLAAGTLVDGLARVADPVVLGIGQSMGGCMTVVQQGRYHC
jgi:alpha-beta hydrolase superfamily lysophospholipase